MDPFRKEDLIRLSEIADEPCISIYMPTQQKTTEFKKDPIRLKNLLADAEKKLETCVQNGKKMKSILEPAHRLIEDWVFWQHQSHGLSLFITPSDFFMYRLPVRFAEKVFCLRRFHLKPLLPLFSNDGKFFILALSQNGNRLLSCTRDAVEEIDIGDAAEGLDQKLDYDTKRDQMQLHYGTGEGVGVKPAQFHGHGVGKDDTKVEILNYFRGIDKDLQPILSNGNAPLVLAGVEYLHPLFSSVTAYPNLIENGIEGNPERLKAEELHRKAWDLVEPRFRRNQEEALKRFEERLGTGLATADFNSVVAGAFQGRVDSLFVASNMERWGKFNRETHQVFEGKEEDPEVEDLLDLAAIATFKNGGTVYAVEPDDIPGGEILSAVMRY